MTGVLDRARAALSGRYELERLLGEGGMAEVFVAAGLGHAHVLPLHLEEALGIGRALAFVLRGRAPGGAAPQGPADRGAPYGARRAGLLTAANGLPRPSP